MDIDLEITPSHDMNVLESNKEKLHGSRFSLEECLEPMMFHAAEKESGAHMPSNEGHQTDGEQIENPDAGKPGEIVNLLDKEQSMEKLRGTCLPLEESLEPKIYSNTGKESSVHFPSNEECQIDEEQNVESLVRSFDKEQNVESEEMRLPEMTSSPNEIAAKHPLSITIDTILDSKLPGGSGIFMTIFTLLLIMCCMFGE